MHSFFSASASATRFILLLSTSLLAVSLGCSDTTMPGAPAKLAFIVNPPASVIAGVAITPAVVVEVQDANGRTVPSANTIITVNVANNPSGAAVSGNVALTAVNGVARFNNLYVDKAGAGYTFSASAPTLASATSTPFEIKPGAATKLAFISQPATTTASASLSTSVVLVDGSGNAVTTGSNVVTITLAPNTTNARLTGMTVVAAVNGIATFNNLMIDRAGTGYALVAATPGFSQAVSRPFDITPGAAVKLGFATQPVSAIVGSPINPVAVAVQDANGNTVTTSTALITVGIDANPAAAILSGDVSVRAVEGVAWFTTLTLDKGGTDYTLTASAPDLTGTISSRFTVRTRLIFGTVSAGYFHSCALGEAGTAYCWGDNSVGQLAQVGLSTSSVSLEVAGGLTFSRISAGRDHTCGVTSVGAAYCWGANTASKLGASVTGSAIVVPALVRGGLTFAEVTAGYDHTCGVTTSGEGYCWGDNSTGELGDGTSTLRGPPTLVTGNLSFASITPGRFFTCGVTTAGVAYCWGSNDEGWLGDGSTLKRSTPVAVAGNLVFRTASAGGFHACGLTTSGAAYCWGSNGYGQLGNGSKSFSHTPTAVAGGLVFASLSVGNRHTCGVTTTGQGYCWGDNSDGKLGDQTTNERLVPAPVAGGLTFVSISAGRFHSCGVTTNNEAYCWGVNGDGKLGDGTTNSSIAPVRVR